MLPPSLLSNPVRVAATVSARHLSHARLLGGRCCGADARATNSDARATASASSPRVGPLPRHERARRASGSRRNAPLSTNVLPRRGLARYPLEHSQGCWRTVRDPILRRPPLLQSKANGHVSCASDLTGTHHHEVPLDWRYGGVLRPECVSRGDLRDDGRTRLPSTADGFSQEVAGACSARVWRPQHLLRHQRDIDGEQGRDAGPGGPV